MSWQPSYRRGTLQRRTRLRSHWGRFSVPCRVTEAFQRNLTFQNEQTSVCTWELLTCLPSLLFNSRPCFSPSADFFCSSEVLWDRRQFHQQQCWWLQWGRQWTAVHLPRLITSGKIGVRLKRTRGEVKDVAATTGGVPATWRSPETECSSPLSSSPAGRQKAASAAPGGAPTGSLVSSRDNPTPVFAGHLPRPLGEFHNCRRFKRLDSFSPTKYWKYWKEVFFVHVAAECLSGASLQSVEQWTVHML